jgi:hypothetical protein
MTDDLLPDIQPSHAPLIVSLRAELDRIEQAGGKSPLLEKRIADLERQRMEAAK